MREILFRGKLKSGGNWMFGCLLIYGNRCFIIPSEELIESEVESRFYWHLLEKNYEVLLETVGQFTGLTGKNGVRIFEGDICRNARNDKVVSVKWHGTMAGFVWSKRKDGTYLSDFGELFRAYDKYEVIGNIHDNPELLEVEHGKAD